MKESRVYDTKSRPAFQIGTGNRIVAVLLGAAVFFMLVSPSMASEDADASKYAAVIAGPILAMLLGFFLWSRSLRRKVADRTNALLESERRYRLLADNTLDVIWTMNLDLEFTYVNPAIFALTGHTPEEWIGSRLREHCDRDNFRKMANAIDSEMKRGPEGAGFIFEFEMLGKNREPVPVEVQGKIICDDDRKPVRVQGTARNVAERKQSEEALRYRERLLREMGGIAKIAGWEFDPVSGEGAWTEELVRIHDLDPEAKVSLKSLLSQYCGESRKRLEEAIGQAAESGKAYDLELELVTAKGNRKWVRIIGRPWIENGKVAQVRGALQDITMHKLSELRVQHLNQILRTVRDINKLIVRERNRQNLIQSGCRLLVKNRGYSFAFIVLTDAGGRIVSSATAGFSEASEKLEALFAQGSLPPCCVNSGFSHGVLQACDKARICERCPIAETCGERNVLCLPLKHQSETFGYICAVAESGPVLDAEEQRLFAEMAGDFAYALSVMKMETERMRGEEERGKLREQLIQAQKMESVGRLAGGIAHDFNNLLSIILGYSESVMEDVGSNHPYREPLREIYEAAARAKDLTRQLLAFSRKQVLEFKRVDINGVVEGFERLLRRVLGEDIELKLNLSSEPFFVEADTAQMEQVLMNLTVNARDAMIDGGTLTIETGKVSLNADCAGKKSEVKPGRYAVIRVGDTGCGMDKETLDCIFDPFFTTKGKETGTGLGLATTYGIVKQHGGHIFVDSEPDRGATFEIYLPVSSGPAAVENEKLQKREIESGSASVLIVEDDPSVRKLAIGILKRGGYNVIESDSVENAIEKAASFSDRLDLILTDVVMPGMKGPEVFARISEHHPEAKVLYMSGYTDDVIARQGVLQNGAGFIQKPFTVNGLLEKVIAVTK